MCKTVHLIRPNTTQSPKHCVMYVIWQTLLVCLTGSISTEARSYLFPGAPERHGCIALVI